jgi:hypothetical protein
MPQSLSKNAKVPRHFKAPHVPKELSAEQRQAVSRIVRDPHSTQERVMDKVVDRLMNELNQRQSSSSQHPE